MTSGCEETAKIVEFTVTPLVTHMQTKTPIVSTLQPFAQYGLHTALRLGFDGELMKHEELQAQIVSRVEYAMTIWASILSSV
jgi:hypothetical protein